MDDRSSFYAGIDVFSELPGVRTLPEAESWRCSRDEEGLARLSEGLGAVRVASGGAPTRHSAQ